MVLINPWDKKYIPAQLVASKIIPPTGGGGSWGGTANQAQPANTGVPSNITTNATTPAQKAQAVAQGTAVGVGYPSKTTTPTQTPASSYIPPVSSSSANTSLANTLNSKYSSQAGATGASSTNRTLGGITAGTDSSFANLRNLLAQSTRLAAAAGPSPEDYLNIYSSRGLALDPSGMSTALNRGTISRSGMIQDTYKSALDLINEQEKRQADYTSSVMSGLPKSFLAQMSGKDFDEIKSGNISPELKQRIAEATALESKAESGFTLSEGQQRYDASGNLLASYGGGGSLITGNPAGIVTTSTGAMYDIGSYATDPTHETKIQNILNNIGQMKDVSQVNQYIQSVAPGSPVTGEMIASASQKYGVSWEAMMAIMQQDSSFGTAGKATSTFNPGNVGNTDSGATVNMGNWQNGVDAVAQNLSRRKTTSQSGTIDFNNKEVVKALPISDVAKSIISGYGTLKDLTPSDKTEVQSELYKVGYDPKSYILVKLDNLLEQLKNVPENYKGLVEGYKPGGWDEKAAAFESARITLTRQIARLFDVGMLSDQDVADYKSAMPSRVDLNYKVSQGKVNGLKESIGAVSSSAIGQQNNKSTPNEGVLSSGLSYTIEE